MYVQVCINIACNLGIHVKAHVTMFISAALVLSTRTLPAPPLACLLPLTPPVRKPLHTTHCLFHPSIHVPCLEGR